MLLLVIHSSPPGPPLPVPPTLLFLILLLPAMATAVQRRRGTPSDFFKTRYSAYAHSSQFCSQTLESGEVLRSLKLSSFLCDQAGMSLAVQKQSTIFVYLIPISYLCQYSYLPFWKHTSLSGSSTAHSLGICHVSYE